MDIDYLQGTVRPAQPFCALVTGANRGLGAALAAQLLARPGSKVVLCVRTDAQAPPAEALLSESGGTGSVVILDYADSQSIVAAAYRCIALLDHLDLLIHCGAINAAPGRPAVESKGPLDKLDHQALIDMFATNVAGPIFASRCLLPILTRSTHPTVIHVSTIRASVALAVGTGSFGYAVTKAALNMATRKLAPYLREHGGTVFAVDPGWLATRMGGPEAPGDPTAAARAIIELAVAGRPDLNGGFLSLAGNHLAW